MAYWLYKSEPETWSWDQQVACGAKGTEWTGVRNFQARNVMRQMKVGERGLFYHSGDVKACVGIVEVIAAAHPDSTATEGDWDCVDLKAVEPLGRAVTLAEAKATPALAAMALVKNTRLSVQPVTDAEWEAVLALAAAPAGDAPKKAAAKAGTKAKAAKPEAAAEAPKAAASPKPAAKAAKAPAETPKSAAEPKAAAKPKAPAKAAATPKGKKPA